MFGSDSSIGPGASVNGYACLAKEMALRQQVIDLAAFGARPKVMALLMGKQVPFTEISRTYRLVSRRETRSGRLPDRRKISTLPKATSAILARLLCQVEGARGFEPVDALLAIWRVYLGAVRAQASGPSPRAVALQPLDFELFLIAVHNLNLGAIDIRLCTQGECRSPNIIVDRSAVLCNCCGRRFDLMRADAARAGPVGLLPPAYFRRAQAA